VRQLLLVLVVACSPEGRSLRSDAAIDSPSDVAPRPDRPVNRVIVGSSQIFWSHGIFQCSLEFGCPDGPTLTQAVRATSTVFTRIDGGSGARTIAGDEQALFLVSGGSTDAMFVHRLDGSGDTALSIPRPLVQGPAVDSTFVYWAEPIDFGLAYTIRRASRSGDGTDASSVVGDRLEVEQLAFAHGQLWWLENRRVVRVDSAGGTAETTEVTADVLLGEDDALFVGRGISEGNGHWDSEIGRFDPDGSYHVIAQQIALDHTPRYLVRDGGRIYWSVDDGRIFSAPATGGAATAEPATSHFAFAVLPDRYLVDFTRDGFRSAPR
jgi:hypothetical protein